MKFMGAGVALRRYLLVMEKDTRHLCVPFYAQALNDRKDTMVQVTIMIHLPG